MTSNPDNQAEVEAVARAMLRDELEHTAPGRDFALAWDEESEVWLMNARTTLGDLRALRTLIERLSRNPDASPVSDGEAGK